MRTDITHLEKFRHTKSGPMATKEGERYGAFFIPHGKDGIVVIYDSGEAYKDEGGVEHPGSGWEHLSARVKMNNGERVPTWEEMCWLKHLFWEDEEVVVQFHPKKSEYVNNHPFVLHLFKEVGKEFPHPPVELVGLKPRIKLQPLQT